MLDASSLADVWKRARQIEPVSLFIGILVTIVVEKSFDKLRVVVARYMERRRWRRTNAAWARYQEIVSEFDVIQAGWTDRKFDEEDAVITVEGDFQIAPPFMEVYTARAAVWEEKGLKNNVQIGVHMVDPHRVSDTLGDKTHLLLMRGHRYRYFEFLATNRLLVERGTPEELAAARAVGDPEWGQPVAGFANPVSVGLTMFCEGGECLALTRRTEKESSGGLWYAGLKFNAVGENVNPRDVVASVMPGAEAVSPWNTARRALTEEIGLSATDLAATQIVLHSFVFDRRIRDYKFFGYAITTLSRSEVYERWLHALDKNESKELFFWKVTSDADRRLVAANIVDDRGDWAPEAAFSTLWTFVHLGWVRPAHLSAG